MQLSIQTKTDGGHIIVYIINSNGVKLVTVRDEGEGSCDLVPGFTYRFEFHVWGAQSADYLIKAKIAPPNPNFEDFNWERHYDGPHQDMGGFYFSL